MHDRFQIEVKRNYVPGRSEQTRYELFTYLFLPYTLGISPRTYTPSDFYRNLQNYVRLRTPRLGAEEFFESPRSPLSKLEALTAQGGPVEEIVSNLKLLQPIAKVALAGLKDAAQREGESAADALIALAQQSLAFCATLLERYRALRQPLEALSSKEADGAYRLVDETLSLLVEQTLLERHEDLERQGDAKKIKKLRGQIRETVADEQRLRDRARAAAGVPPMRDDDLIERLSLLKKYSSEVLFLRADRKPEGKAIEHLALAGAAGLAMAVATFISFFSQRYWHSYSLELFAAFVCGYMFKDRIKEIARAWFAAALHNRRDDHRLLLSSRDGSRRLGYIRERVRFLGVGDVPADVRKMRRSWTEHALLDAPRTRGEVVLLHRRQVVFDPASLAAAGERVGFDGLSDISRLDVRPFLTKMDDPRARRRRFQGDHVETVRYQRTYPIYLITAIRSNANEEPKAVTAARVLLNRKGVRGIESLHGVSLADEISSAA